ncbi:MAG TPA: hypothetical protein DEQ40_00150 [Oxalobacteraceae bacterium]|nr:hypothetical protein [Oxalobacteraceae bacterium]
MPLFLQNFLNRRRDQKAKAAEERELRYLQRLRQREMLARMQPEDLAAHQHQEALSAMYDHGQGMLSPALYQTKDMSFSWIGFGVGCLFAAYKFDKAGWLNEDSFWLTAGALTLSLCAGLAGVLIAGTIFRANFVEDESLKDPLFRRR